MAGYHRAARLRGRLVSCGAEARIFERRQEIYVHLVWSTWDRAPTLTHNVRAWLWPVLAEQARELGCPWAVVGGVQDHVHLLCALPTTVAVADLVRHVKGWTARAANAQRPDSLRWQGGYGVFSVSPTDLPIVEADVRNQADHHRTAELRDAWEWHCLPSAKADGDMIARQFIGRVQRYGPSRADVEPEAVLVHLVVADL